MYSMPSSGLKSLGNMRQEVSSKIITVSPVPNVDVNYFSNQRCFVIIVVAKADNHRFPILRKILNGCQEIIYCASTLII